MNVRNQTFMESTFIFILKISEICESECKLELFTKCQTDSAHVQNDPTCALSQTR